MTDGPTQAKLFEEYESERPPERKQPNWYYLDRFPVYENSHQRAKPVVCEPCHRGGGPKDCIRPCTHQGGRAMRGSPA